MGRVSRWEYLREIHPRYRKAGRLERGRMLAEFCRVTGYHRKYAVRILNGPPPEKRPRKRRPRRPTCATKVVSVLAAFGEAAGYPWLKALIPDWLPWAKKHFDRRLREHKSCVGL